MRSKFALPSLTCLNGDTELSQEEAIVWKKFKERLCKLHIRGPANVKKLSRVYRTICICHACKLWRTTKKMVCSDCSKRKLRLCKHHVCAFSVKDKRALGNIFRCSKGEDCPPCRAGCVCSTKKTHCTRPVCTLVQKARCSKMRQLAEEALTFKLKYERNTKFVVRLSTKSVILSN